jgi:hypothetical protein
MTDPFSGILEGSRVTLSFKHKLFSPGEWTGTLSGSRLSLTYPGPDGGATRLSFAPTDDPSYASALRALVTPSPPAEVEGSITPARIDKDAEAVRKDLSELRSDVANAADEASVAGAAAVLTPVKDLLELAQSWVRAASRAALQARIRVNPDRVCAFATEAATAAARVSGYTSQVLGRVAASRNLIEQIRADMDRLGAHHARLVTDLLALPTYRPHDVPTNKEIARAIEAGGSVIRQGDPLANEYESSANAKVSVAFGYSAQARAECGHGG